MVGTQYALQVGEAESPSTKSVVTSGEIPDLHNDPAKVHQLLDLLSLPEGTQVKVVTTATSVIVR